VKQISVEEALAFDQMAQRKLGLSSLILMENAGRSVAEEALKIPAQKILIICGVGNNGGDGFVAARHLLNAGKEVKVSIVGNPDKLKPDPKANLKVLEKLKVDWKPANELRGFQEVDLVIDSLFGIGLNADIREPYLSVINKINQAEKPVLAVDVPSGLDADTGKVLGVAVKAQTTVTFVAPKRGFYLASGPECCGNVIVRNIGVDPQGC